MNTSILSRENSFLKILGELRESNQKKYLEVIDVAPLTDWNELTHHLLEVVFVHLQNTRGPIPVG